MLALQALLSQDKLLAQRLNRELELFEAGILNAEEFKTSLNGVVSAYRERVEALRLPEVKTQAEEAVSDVSSNHS